MFHQNRRSISNKFITATWKSAGRNIDSNYKQIFYMQYSLTSQRDRAQILALVDIFTIFLVIQSVFRLFEYSNSNSNVHYDDTTTSIFSVFLVLQIR